MITRTLGFPQRIDTMCYITPNHNKFASIDVSKCKILSHAYMLTELPTLSIRTLYRIENVTQSSRIVDLLWTNSETTVELNRRFRRRTFLWKLGIVYAGGAQQLSVHNPKFCSGSLLQSLILVLIFLQKCDAENKDSECQWITSAIMLVVRGVSGE